MAGFKSTACSMPAIGMCPLCMCRAVAAPVVEAPHPSGFTLEERFNLCRGVAEECISEDELRNLLKHRPNPVAYDGFEPSGRMHIAQVCLPSCSTSHLGSAGAITQQFMLFSCMLAPAYSAHCAAEAMCSSILHAGCDEGHQCQQAHKHRLHLQVLGRRLVCAAQQQDGGGPEEDPDSGQVHGGGEAS